MKIKLRLKLIAFLKRWLDKLNLPSLVQEHETRKSLVRTFFHETLPTLDEQWAGKAIIEGASFNYFLLPNNTLPSYDFVLPEIPLYVLVPGICSASWEFAQRMGITRSQWEEEQYHLAFIEASTHQLATIGKAAAPKIIIIKWEEPINNISLIEKLQETIK